MSLAGRCSVPLFSFSFILVSLYRLVLSSAQISEANLTVAVLTAPQPRSFRRATQNYFARNLRGIDTPVNIGRLAQRDNLGYCRA